MKWLEPLHWIVSTRHAHRYDKVVVITKSNNRFITEIIPTGDKWNVWDYQGNDPTDPIVGWWPLPAIPDDTSKMKQLYEDDPVERLELGIRATNCLIRDGLLTIKDVLSKTVDELLKIRNMGKKTFSEVDEALRLAGFYLEK